MKSEIINIGNELLIGQVVNTNAAWMAEQLNMAGFSVGRINVIPDHHDDILQALEEAGKRAAIVLITGGLGPTKDDITKKALCEFFNAKLIFSDEAYKDVERLFVTRGLPVTELNRQQAFVPDNCIPIPNRNGTAPGMWFEGQRTADGRPPTADFISLPGVPFEMKAMMKDQVILRLKEKFHPGVILHRTVMTQGIGESFLSDILEPWETTLPKNITLAYLPQPGIVRLRLTGTGENENHVAEMVDDEIRKMEALVSDYIYGYDDETLEEIIGRLLEAKNATLATAESCTGGYIAHLITSIPGSSRYFKGSIVAYSNDIKELTLGVLPDSIAKHGAVSETVVAEMAIGAQSRLDADYVIAVSGIAGPDGGTKEKPVGTTWIAVATPEGVFAQHVLLGDHRERNIRRAALQALNMLRKELV
jgi:nicotinamide-nucleotide amidase